MDAFIDACGCLISCSVLFVLLYFFFLAGIYFITLFKRCLWLFGAIISTKLNIDRKYRVDKCITRYFMVIVYILNWNPIEFIVICTLVMVLFHFEIGVNGNYITLHVLTFKTRCYWIDIRIIYKLIVDAKCLKTKKSFQIPGLTV